MKLTQRSKRMWKVVITEIQDASAIDPAYAPPGAFFVSTERFARTVKNLDLPKNHQRHQSHAVPAARL